MKNILTALMVLLVLGGIGAAVYMSSAKDRADQPSAGSDVRHTADAVVVQVVDRRGRTFTFESPPERIAACSAFSLEILMAMDHTPVLRFDGAHVYPPQAESIPVVNRSHSIGPDVEQLMSQQPDLIVLHEVFGQFADAVEQQVGAPVMVMNIKSVDEVRENLVTFGKLTGNTDAADTLVQDLDRTRQWIVANKPVGDPPLALSLLGQEDAWYAHRGNHFMGSLLDSAGAENAAASDAADAKYRSLTPLDLEQVISKDPDVIFLIPYGDSDQDLVVKRFRDHPATQSLRAVRNNRVHVLPDTIYTRQPGPRTGLALRNLYTFLYPNAEAPG